MNFQPPGHVGLETGLRIDFCQTVAKCAQSREHLREAISLHQGIFRHIQTPTVIQHNPLDIPVQIFNAGPTRQVDGIGHAVHGERQQTITRAAHRFDHGRKGARAYSGERLHDLANALPLGFLRKPRMDGVKAATSVDAVKSGLAVQWKEKRSKANSRATPFGWDRVEPMMCDRLQNKGVKQRRGRLKPNRFEWRRWRDTIVFGRLSAQLQNTAPHLSVTGHGVDPAKDEIMGRARRVDGVDHVIKVSDTLIACICSPEWHPEHPKTYPQDRAGQTNAAKARTKDIRIFVARGPHDLSARQHQINPQNVVTKTSNGEMVFRVDIIRESAPHGHTRSGCRNGKAEPFGQKPLEQICEVHTCIAHNLPGHGIKRQNTIQIPGEDRLTAIIERRIPITAPAPIGDDALCMRAAHSIQQSRFTARGGNGRPRESRTPSGRQGTVNPVRHAWVA